MFARPDMPSTVWYDPLVLPFILIFFGVLVLVGGHLSEARTSKKVPGKWVGAGLLGFAVIYGLRYPFFLTDTIYRMTISDYPKRYILMHYVAFLAPFIVAVLVGVWLWLDRRNQNIR